MYPNWNNWNAGTLERYSLQLPLPGLSYHVCHHAQLLGGIMDEEVFMGQG